MTNTAQTRRAIIEQALADTYTTDGIVRPGSMISGLAVTLELNWEAMKARAEIAGTDFANEVRNSIWDWFSGGNTAKTAAEHVIDLVKVAGL